MVADLVQFLRACFDEDEQAACAWPADQRAWEARGRRQVGYDSGVLEGVSVISVGGPGPCGWERISVKRDVDGLAGHIACHDPARVLREIDAKRKLVDEHKPGMQKGWPNMGRHCLSCTGARVWDESSNESNCLTLRLLALPYADRPGYRNEWRP
jgi:hypothetical protein